LSTNLFAQSNDHLYRPVGKSIPKKSFEFESKASLFSTASNLDIDGSEVALNEDDSFTQIDGQLSLRYGFGDSLELSGGLNFRSVQATYLVGNETISAANSGVESYFVGAKYSKRSSTSSRLFYALDIGVSQTAYNNSTFNSLAEIPTDEIVLGDSGNQYHLGVGISYMRTKDHYLSAWGAFRQPANNLSAEVPYFIESAWTWTKFALVMNLQGIYSLGSDEFSSNPLLKTPQSRGPSALYNSIDRQLMAPGVAGYMIFGRWRVGVEARTVFSGVSTDKGTSFGVSLLRSSIGASKIEKKKNTFKEYRIEATILKVSPRGKFVQIDNGISQDVEKGMRFDIYQSDFFGGNELIAQGIAYEVAGDRSILKIVKKYSRKRVKKGFTARAE
jgi:hypothetical protein